MSDCTYTNTLTFECTQNWAHIHTNKIISPIPPKQKIYHINWSFLKTFHSVW